MFVIKKWIAEKLLGQLPYGIIEDKERKLNLIKLLQDYSDDKYRRSLRKLFNFKTLYPNFIEKFIALQSNAGKNDKEEAEFNEIDEARRNIWMFAVTMYFASEDKFFATLIQKKATLIWGGGFYRAIQEIIKPIMDHNDFYNKAKHDDKIFQWAANCLTEHNNNHPNISQPNNNNDEQPLHED